MGQKRPSGKEKDATPAFTASDGASLIVSPSMRHGFILKLMAGEMFNNLPGDPSPVDFGAEAQTVVDAALKGDIRVATELLTYQALTLDGMFTLLANQASGNLGKYPQAGERYARLALKAQANSRATLEALAKIHQPRTQTVRHVHVNEGGQAIVADEFHHHTGGAENAETIDQPHATGNPSGSSAMLRHDAQGNGVPIPSHPRKAPVPDARRERQRGADG